MTGIRSSLTCSVVPRRDSFDVLVIGSGASGLAAAVSADRAGARVALATKTTLQACNSAKAQGGIQAAFGEDDSPEIHAEDVDAKLARDGRPAARRGLDGRGAVGDPLARGAGRRVHPGDVQWPEWPRPYRRRRVPAGALRRSDAAASPAGRRPHRPRDHEGAARGVRGRRGNRAASPRSGRPSSGRERLDRDLRDEGRRRGRRRRVIGGARGGRSLLPRGRDARRALDEPPQRDR